MKKLACPVCRNPMDQRHRAPVALPACGHTSCRRCLIAEYAIEGGLKCPTCRKGHPGAEPEDLPVNFALLQLMGPEEEATKEMGKRGCPVCSNPLNRGQRAPVALPACGHTACRRCLLDAHAAAGGIKCPTCKKGHPGAEPEDLPVNFALLQLMDPEEEVSTLQSAGAAGLGARGVAAGRVAGVVVGATAAKAYEYVFGGDGEKKK